MVRKTFTVFILVYYNIYFNARVEMSPKELKKVVLKALESVIGSRLRVTVHDLRAFRPARPRPVYRYAEPV